MERVYLTTDQHAMIERRVQSALQRCRTVYDWNRLLADIYFQGFADCYEAMSATSQEGQG